MDDGTYFWETNETTSIGPYKSAELMKEIAKYTSYPENTSYQGNMRAPYPDIFYDEKEGYFLWELITPQDSPGGRRLTLGEFSQYNWPDHTQIYLSETGREREYPKIEYDHRIENLGFSPDALIYFVVFNDSFLINNEKRESDYFGYKEIARAYCEGFFEGYTLFWNWSFPYIGAPREEVEQVTWPNRDRFALGELWHLNGDLTNINITETWADGYSGGGITVGVINAVIDIDHFDLDANIDLVNSRSYCEEEPTLLDDDDDGDAEQNHGTFVSGLIAAENNNQGVVGVAFDSQIIFYRVIGCGVIQNALEDYITNSQIDISQNSWGIPYKESYIDDFGVNRWRFSSELNVPKRESERVELLESLASDGRSDLGVIIVFSAGNDNERFGRTDYRGTKSSRYTVTVGSIDQDGTHSIFSNPGSSIFLVAPGGRDITSTSSAGEFDDGFGTSYSAPLVSGTVALMLEANPDLGWRDVQHILARTAVKTDPTSDSWSENGAGFHISHDYGFGLVDAGAAVNLALEWVNVGEEETSTEFTTRYFTYDCGIWDWTFGPFEDDCSGGQWGGEIPNENPDAPLEIQMTIDENILMEAVEIEINLDHNAVSDLQIELISPSGTSSIFSEPHQMWDGSTQITASAPDDWLLTTVRNWGENSKGTWTLRISDHFADNSGDLIDWKLNIYGTDNDLDDDGEADDIDPDKDGDGWLNVEENFCGTDEIDATDFPLYAGCRIDADYDEDGWSNEHEDLDCKTDPKLISNLNGDLLDWNNGDFSGYELVNHDIDFDLICNELDVDDDGDDYYDKEEEIAGSDPLNHLSTPFDKDGDGYSFGEEIHCGSDDSDALSYPVDTDGDGICDGIDVDDDNDGILDVDDGLPLDAMDTDSDGITDLLDDDDDGDGFPDNQEINCGSDSRDSSDPVESDSISGYYPNFDLDWDSICDRLDWDDDGDGSNDLDEWHCGTDSLDSNSIPLDTDQDSICNKRDLDDDGDGHLDWFDDFPLDACYWEDRDEDGLPSNIALLSDCPPTTGALTLDNDDDDDGVLDSADAFPLYAAYHSDTDGDDIADRRDFDDDGDGVVDAIDSHPLDSTEWKDTDRDGIGNNADWDDDGDYVADVNDAFPLDSTESVDTDGDGIGNNADFNDDGDLYWDGEDDFPLNPSEWLDTDSDGIGDNADLDDDGDGFADTLDFAPLDPNEWIDSDGDGIGDNSDLFPNNPQETSDFDADGIGDNSDPDVDGDSVPDWIDQFDFDANSWSDFDGDGVEDCSDSDWDGDGVMNFNTIDPSPFCVSNNFILNTYLFSPTGIGGTLIDTDLDSITDIADADTDGDGILDWACFSYNPNLDSRIKEQLFLNYVESMLIQESYITTTTNMAQVHSLIDSLATQMMAVCTGAPVAQDEFRFQSTENSDLDGDGVGDVSDPFDSDSTKWRDSDSDSIADSIDTDDDGDGTLDWNDHARRDSTIQTDTDGDGIDDSSDIDKDGDSIQDFYDDFPLDSSEWNDQDGDGVGDNSDRDVDGDTVANFEDSFPYNANEWKDTDRDGIGDNSDSDIDGDSHPNWADAFPFDRWEYEDHDADGIGDFEDRDDDNDGVMDLDDRFPRDASESKDTDNDAIGNNADSDDDGDGILDVDDAFPLDRTEHSDLDGDGIGDNSDLDSDGDGIWNHDDAFPLDQCANKDTDRDGLPDSIIASCTTELSEDDDDDGDGVLDAVDAFPLDASEQSDSDSDGIGDNLDPYNDVTGVWLGMYDSDWNPI